MRPTIVACGFLMICVLAFGPDSLAGNDNKPARLREMALATMENIVPHNPADGAMAKITFGNNHAIWGKIFGDEQVAALVAVDISVHPDNDWPEDATLFLLLWQDGWRFRQLVGKVSSATSTDDLVQFHIEKWDWDIKRRPSPETYYVLSRRELYPAGDHLSWLCDPKSHTLVPTGWRKDAIPSVSGSTITFEHQDKPGFGPVIYNIYSFSDHPGELIASFDTDDINGQPSAHGFAVRDIKSGKMVSWWFWMKGHSDGQYAVSRHGPGIGGAYPSEDATVYFDWPDIGAYRRDTDYFLWRLAGLQRNATWGIWDQDEKPEVSLPRSVKVTGLPDAVEKFTWPPLGPSKD